MKNESLGLCKLTEEGELWITSDGGFHMLFEG